MASELEANATSEERRTSRLFPIIVGVVGPPPSDRIVLVNPVTQGMVVLQGEASLVSELLGGGGGGGAPPASEASIEALIPVVGGGEEECVVCLESLTEEAKEMPCAHRYHDGCIKRWLRIHGSCPVCRYRMPVEDRSGSDKREEREVWITIRFGRRGRRDDDAGGDGDHQ